MSEPKKGDYVIVTRDGRIMNSDRVELIAQETRRGYMRVGVWDGYEQRKHFVHRLVWEAFEGPIPDEMTIDHIDGNKKNNHLSNLRVLSRGDNVRAYHERVGPSQDWAQLKVEYEASNQSLVEFAKSKGLAKSTLRYHWKKGTGDRK